MSTLAQDLQAAHDGHVRLSILRLLDGAPGYSANCSVLCQSVNSLGLVVTRDQTRSHLAWLAEQRAVSLLWPSAALAVATLTERGSDLAHGRSVISGVQRPGPGA